jgi:type IV pilus assembly protein PilC
MLGVVPGFRAVFDSMDAELPGITQLTLGTAEFMKGHWGICFGGFFGALAGVFLFSRTESGGWFFDRFSLKVPVFGPLIRKVCLARFSRTFATLIRSGVPIMATLDIVAETAGNRVVAKAVMNGDVKRLYKESREYLNLRTKRKQFISDQRASTAAANGD